MPQQDVSLFARPYRRYVIIIAVVFVALRLFFFRQVYNTPVFTLPILDSEFYHLWAIRLARGWGSPPGPFWLSPLYSFFMAGLFKAFGSASVGLVVITQMALSAATITLLARYTLRLFGPVAALIAAALAALYAPWLYYDGVMLSASLILFLNVLALNLLITRTSLAGRSADELPSGFAREAVWIPIGLLIGISALARPSVLLFGAALAGWLVLERKAQWLTRAALLLGAMFIMLLPVLIRNYNASGSWILTTSSGGINFYIGNRNGASGMYDEMDFIRSFDPTREAEGYRAEASRRVGHKLTLNQASGYWGRLALTEILQNPGDWLRLMLKKAWLTVQREEIANNISFRGVSGFAPIVGGIPLRWNLLFPLAAAGALLSWRRRRDTRLLWIYAGCYLLVNLIFFSASEYRFPMLAVMLPAAACLFVDAARVVREQDYRNLTWACVFYIVAMVICNLPSKDVARASIPRADYYNMATGAVDRGMWIDAVPLYARALAVDPSYQEARIGLAKALWKLGNFDDARQEFELAGVAAPDSLSGAPLENFLEELYFHTEDADYEGALRLLDERFPADLEAPVQIWVNRAMVEYGLTHREQAVSALIKATVKDKESPEWPYRAGVICVELGQQARADTLFGESLRRYPAYAPARVAMARLNLAQKDTLAAREQLDQLRRIRIQDDSMRVQIRWLANDLGEKFEFSTP